MVNLSNLLFNLNMRLRHPDKCEHEELSPTGKYPESKFFIIRFDDRGTGLFGLVDIAMGACEYAEAKGLIPLIDFRGGVTQYAGTGNNDNAWEYFFKQPYLYSLEEIDEAKYRLMMGYDSKTPRCIKAETIYSPETIQSAHNFLARHLFLSDLAEKAVKAELSRINCTDMLGVFARGTDYAALQPAQHPRQPSVEQLIGKIDEYLVDKPDCNIFLVTEDKTIYDRLLQYYGEKIFVSGHRFIDNYEGKDLVANYVKNPNEQGLEYLIRVFMLSQCRALIGGRAAGSNFATVLNGNKYEYRYIFELGHYREENT